MINQFPKLTLRIQNEFKNNFDNITDKQLINFIENNKIYKTFNQLTDKEKLYYVIDIPPIYHKPDINDTFITYMSAIIKEIILCNREVCYNN